MDCWRSCSIFLMFSDNLKQLYAIGSPVSRVPTHSPIIFLRKGYGLDKLPRSGGGTLRVPRVPRAGRAASVSLLPRFGNL